MRFIVTLFTLSLIGPQALASSLDLYVGKYRLIQSKRGCYENLEITKTAKNILKLQFSENDPNLTVAPFTMRADSKTNYRKNPTMRTRIEAKVSNDQMTNFIDHALDCERPGIERLWGGGGCDPDILVDYILVRQEKSLRYIMQEARAGDNDTFVETRVVDCTYAK